MSVRTNVEEVLNRMDAHVATIRDTALPRALNKVRDQAQVAGFRVISQAYGVSRTNMMKYGRVRLKYATAGDQSSAIIVGGITFPLYIFPHRQTKAGVEVTLHGKRYLFPGSFMIKSRGTKVFARGSYTGRGGGSSPFRPTGSVHWNLRYGRGRFPITLLRTMSPRGVFKKADVVDAMQARAREQMPKVLQQEIRFAARSRG